MELLYLSINLLVIKIRKQPTSNNYKIVSVFMELEHFFQCPYCWEEVSMILDASVSQQTYIEDCEVCCNPIEVSPMFENGELVAFYSQSIEQ